LKIGELMHVASRPTNLKLQQREFPRRRLLESAVDEWLQRPERRKAQSRPENLLQSRGEERDGSEIGQITVRHGACLKVERRYVRFVFFTMRSAAVLQGMVAISLRDQC
jgi:hypothetical protein